MARRLPPLNALRAFEAAARHLSFVDAADELAVTPAAVSHQVKALEGHLGVTLFERLPRSLLLTEQGRILAPQLTRGFDRLAEAVARVRVDDVQTVLSVTVLPSFAVRWLLPRLAGFRRLNPGLEIEVHAQHHPVDFRRERVDVALRYGRGGWAGLHAERFLDDEVFPVCSPRLLEGPRPLLRPEDLRHHTLIHDVLTGDDEPWVTWQHWLLHFGLDDVDHRRRRTGPLRASPRPPSPFDHPPWTANNTDFQRKFCFDRLVKFSLRFGFRRGGVGGTGNPVAAPSEACGSSSSGGSRDRAPGRDDDDGIGYRRGAAGLLHTPP
jgi:LysR family glycine cleavage system transcriptional activator